MTDISFAGYRAFAPGADDPLCVKWRAMRANIGGFSGPTLPALDLASIEKFNAQIDRMIAFDATELESLDAWQSPAQTLLRKRGDCKDFALIKYASLLDAGVPEDQLRVVIGEIGSTRLKNPGHAWCAAYLDGDWRALDNMYPEIIRVADYLNWIPAAAMHGDSVVCYGREFSINSIIHPKV